MKGTTTSFLAMPCIRARRIRRLELSLRSPLDVSYELGLRPPLETVAFPGMLSDSRLGPLGLLPLTIGTRASSSPTSLPSTTVSGSSS